MISINLLPDVKKDLLRVRRERNLIISISIIVVGVSIAALVIMGVTLGGLTIAKNVSEGNIEKYEKTIKNAKNTKQLDKYLTIQNQLSQVNNLKDEQQIYSRIMSYLEQLNPAEPNSAMLRTAKLEAAGSSDSSSSSDGVALTIEGTVRDFPALDVYKNTLIKAQLVYEDRPEIKELTDDVDNKDDNSDGEASGLIYGADSADKSDDNNSTETTKANKENLFSEVQVLESSLSSDGSGSLVRFSIKLVFNANAFNQSYITKIEVPHETTSDGDRNAPKVTFNKTELVDEQASQSTDNTNNSQSTQEVENEYK